jgi:hypothetical protein
MTSGSGTHDVLLGLVEPIASAFSGDGGERR